MTAKSLATYLDNSELLAFRSNIDGIERFATSFDYHCVNLYRHRKSHRYFLSDNGGQWARVRTDPRWLTREKAVEWIAIKARDPVTGYGYDREQAERMANGEDAGKGYREIR